jgi:hypothetical protein
MAKHTSQQTLCIRVAMTPCLLQHQGYMFRLDSRIIRLDSRLLLSDWKNEVFERIRGNGSVMVAS